MSDLTPHTRNDLVELPCDCEMPFFDFHYVAGNPAATSSYGHSCGCSPYLCPTCNPRRKLVAAVRDVSAVRDLPIWVWDDLLLPKAELISLAHARAQRQGRRG